MPAERRAQLNARFEALAQQAPHAAQRYASYRPPLKLEFRSGMPAFGETLTADEITAILDFIKSTWPERIRQAREQRLAPAP